MRLAQATASMPVALRPPWVKTSHLPGCAFPWRRWRPRCIGCRISRAASSTKSGSRHRGGVDRDLVGAGEQQAADVLDLAHAAADGQRHEACFGRAPHHVLERVAILGRGGDVEEAELVGAGGVVDAAPARPDRRHRRRSTKLTPLTTRPSLTSRQGMTRIFSIRRLSAWAMARLEIEPAVVERAARDHAGDAAAVLPSSAAARLSADRDLPARRRRPRRSPES